MTVDQNRLSQELAELAQISEAAAPAVTRILFSEFDMRGREFVKKLCREAGLSIREDAAGNMFARWNGSRRSCELSNFFPCPSDWDGSCSQPV